MFHNVMKAACIVYMQKVTHEVIEINSNYILSNLCTTIFNNTNIKISHGLVFPKNHGGASCITSNLDLTILLNVYNVTTPSIDSPSSLITSGISPSLTTA